MRCGVITENFALAISRTEKRGEETVRPAAYLPCEIWRKNGSADSFAQLTKGALVEITGWIRPEEFVDKTGTRHFKEKVASAAFSFSF